MCQYKIQKYGKDKSDPVYSWCDLSDNPCTSDTGNPDFDKECENDTEESS